MKNILLILESLECKRELKWICDFIVAQCSRPPPAHSKDLHSGIVAAFHCAKTWLLHHPYLLQDKECLGTVLEVIELGISGTKSQSKPSEAPVMKEAKGSQPASRRVRDAAESLLTSLLEQVDFYTVYCGAESLSTMIDEVSFLYLSSGEMMSMLQAAQNFRYFVLDNNILLGIFEDTNRTSYDLQAKVREKFYLIFNLNDILKMILGVCNFARNVGPIGLDNGAETFAEAQERTEIFNIKSRTSHPDGSAANEIIQIQFFP